MKLGRTLFLVALAAALLVPAAVAKPGNGNGNGNGHGPPAWAGNGGAKKAEKQAEKAVRKAEKAAQKAERRARHDAVKAGDSDVPRHDNPAWVCKFERERMAEAFAEEYGTNGSGANAFGKCVSREAHDRDGVTPDDEAETPPDDPASPAEDEAETETVDSADVFAALQTFFQALRQLVI